MQTSRLGSFVGAILRRPTLAAATRALVFYENKNEWSRFDPYEVTVGWDVGDPDGVFRRALTALGGHLEREWPASRKWASLETLQGLAMASTPNLSQVCLQSPGQWESWTYGLPSLRYLAFAGNRTGSGWEHTYDLEKAQALLRCAPNLDTLVAPDCGGGLGNYLPRRRLAATEPWGMTGQPPEAVPQQRGRDAAPAHPRHVPLPPRPRVL